MRNQTCKISNRVNQKKFKSSWKEYVTWTCFEFWPMTNNIFWKLQTNKSLIMESLIFKITLRLYLNIDKIWYKILSIFSYFKEILDINLNISFFIIVHINVNIRYLFMDKNSELIKLYYRLLVWEFNWISLETFVGVLLFEYYCEYYFEYNFEHFFVCAHASPNKKLGPWNSP